MGGTAIGKVGPVHWTEVSSDPNSPAALGYRKRTLVAAHRPPVEDRLSYIVDLVRGRRVLDVGAVDHVAEQHLRHNHLHVNIARVAATCVGADVEAEGVDALTKEGYDVRVADITASNFPEIVGTDFEVLVAGELIEHIERPDMLMENARKVLRSDGRLILTSPNPYSIHLIGYYARGRVEENVDHIVYYFPSGIAELADRHGWKLVGYRGAYHPGAAKSLRWKAVRLANRFLSGDLSCWTYIFELEPLAK